MDPLAHTYKPSIEVLQKTRMKNVIKDIVKMYEKSFFDKLEREFESSNRYIFD